MMQAWVSESDMGTGRDITSITSAYFTKIISMRLMGMMKMHIPQYNVAYNKCLRDFDFKVTDRSCSTCNLKKNSYIGGYVEEVILF